MKKKILIITGPMHSGTSLLAKIIHKNYVKMTEPLNCDTKYDYMGYENKKFHNIIMQFFNKTNITIDSNGVINVQSIPEPDIYKKYLDNFSNIFDIPVVFKAPYMCFLLGRLKKKFNCYILYTIRNEKDNINSLMKRDNLSYSKAILILKKFKEHLKFNLQFFNNVCEVSFEKLLDNDKNELKKIEEFMKKWKNK